MYEAPTPRRQIQRLFSEGTNLLDSNPGFSGYTALKCTHKYCCNDRRLWSANFTEVRTVSDVTKVPNANDVTKVRTANDVTEVRSASDVTKVRTASDVTKVRTVIVTV